MRIEQPFDYIVLIAVVVACSLLMYHVGWVDGFNRALDIAQTGCKG